LKISQAKNSISANILMNIQSSYNS